MAKKTDAKKTPKASKSTPAKTPAKKAAAKKEPVATKSKSPARTTAAAQKTAQKKTAPVAKAATKKTVTKKTATTKATTKKAGENRPVVKKSATQATAKKSASTKASAKKAGAKKTATGRKPVVKQTAARRANQPSDSLLAFLAQQSGQPSDVVLERALLAYAAAQGIALGPDAPFEAFPFEPRSEQVEETPAVASEDADIYPDDSHLPALGPPVRLYIHPPARPPQEMINDTFVIGASPKADLWLKYPTLEAQHLRIVREGSRYFAEDVGTQKGSIVHGERVTRYEIKHEDDIFLAGFLRVRFYLVK